MAQNYLTESQLDALSQTAVEINERLKLIWLILDIANSVDDDAMTALHYWQEIRTTLLPVLSSMDKQSELIYCMLANRDDQKELEEWDKEL